MNTILPNVLIIVLTIVGLWYGAILLVEGATRLARRFGISELVIGLTVVAMGTSMPEFAVTIFASLRGQSDMSVGNIVGSNIFNLAIILGGVVAIRAVTISKKLVYRDGSFLIGTSFLLLFFMYDLTLERWEGAVLFLLLIGYITFLIMQREETDEDVPDGDFQPTDIIRLLAGIAIVLLSGQFLVSSATTIAKIMGVSDWVIAVTIIAAGTSAPEMATSFIAAVRGHQSLSIGNLIGSDLFNKLGVLGLAAIIQPTTHALVIDPAGFNSLATLCVMVTIAVFFMWTGWRLARWEGVVLLIIGLVRWGFDIIPALG